MMSEEDIKNHHKQIEELKNKKSKGLDDNRGPLDLTKRIEVLEFRNEKLHKYNEKLTEEVRTLRRKLNDKG
tara:strand:- start:566 stop:778 length:213 start_codon:yes stop_codon:yes gene_type:complete